MACKAPFFDQNIHQVVQLKVIIEQQHLNSRNWVTKDSTTLNAKLKTHDNHVSLGPGGSPEVFIRPHVGAQRLNSNSLSCVLKVK